jgi:hypothetical protein
MRIRWFRYLKDDEKETKKETTIEIKLRRKRSKRK